MQFWLSSFFTSGVRGYWFVLLLLDCFYWLWQRWWGEGLAGCSYLTSNHSQRWDVWDQQGSDRPSSLSAPPCSFTPPKKKTSTSYFSQYLCLPQSCAWNMHKCVSLTYPTLSNNAYLILVCKGFISTSQASNPIADDYLSRGFVSPRSECGGGGLV